MHRLRIIFMGTPDFAVPSLQILLENGYQIVGVVTAPDKPSGRGLKLQASAIKEYAEKTGLRVLQPEKLKDPAFLEELKSLEADLQVVVAFRMLPEVVWSMPKLGTFNLHASLLPDYRGAAPINHAIINGESVTGATTFFLQHQIDTGDIIFQTEVGIAADEDAGSLHDKLMMQGAELVLKTVKAIEAGEVKTHPQPQIAIVKDAPKIFKEDCKIDWQKNISDIYNKIRGLSPYPTAWTILDNKVFKIYKAKKESVQVDLPVGTLITDQKSYLKVAVKGGYIDLDIVQMEGKKKMGVADLLRGYNIHNLSV